MFVGGGEANIASKIGETEKIEETLSITGKSQRWLDAEAKLAKAAIGEGSGPVIELGGSGEIGDLNKIRNYRGVDLSNVEARYIANPDYIVDMPYVGKGMSGPNSQGWMRNSEYFFENLQKQSPEIFSKQNTKLINSGLAPEVDSTFTKYFPQYEDYIGQELKHHHIGGGGQAMPIPAELHPGSGGIHNIEKSLGIFGDSAIDATNAHMLQYIKDNTRRTRLWKRK